VVFRECCCEVSVVKESVSNGKRVRDKQFPITIQSGHVPHVSRGMKCMGFARGLVCLAVLGTV
jgi:hypothetical protein